MNSLRNILLATCLSCGVAHADLGMIYDSDNEGASENQEGGSGNNANPLKDFTFSLRNSFNFTKSNVTGETLDKNKYLGIAGASSFWESDRQYNTFILTPRAFWKSPDYPFFVQVGFSYGWLLNGRAVTYPLRWDVDGHTYGVGVKTGYIWKVCDRFDVAPYIGYRFIANRSEVSHQFLAKNNPSAFANFNHTKTHTYLNFPYIGVEISFNSTFCDCYKVQFATSYEIGYGGGNKYIKAPRFIATNSGNTSVFGSHIKYRDMVEQNFAIAASHSFKKHWIAAIELDYGTIYNTHSLPLKYQHNERLVQAGQFKKSQFHRISDDVTQTFSIVFGIAYSFGEAGEWITR